MTEQPLQTLFTPGISPDPVDYQPQQDSKNKRIHPPPIYLAPCGQPSKNSTPAEALVPPYPLTQGQQKHRIRSQAARCPRAPPKSYAARVLRTDKVMDRFDVIHFSDLSGPNGSPNWVRIGGGSFGVVFQGEYLGTPVAIKEVLANNTYDVEKYFERECVLMKEARHPNIVQYIGLTRSPGPDARIYIISEFVGGNVRSFIADKTNDFPWRLRISFAMDIARAVAYLHARNCMHRDLKGENILITPNQRIKLCDFGFARIAARNEEEMRRMSYCGTDGYMSPEILMGLDFSLPSDVFSLGIIFCEIASRHLVDSRTFKRTVPDFGLDFDEIRQMASPGCPESFVRLCLDCVTVEPSYRPDMREIVRRLITIEKEVVVREEREARGTVRSVGSVKSFSMLALCGSKSAFNKAQSSRKLPSFRQDNASTAQNTGAHSRDSSDGSSEEELETALAQLEAITIGQDREPETFKIAGYGNPWACDQTMTVTPTHKASEGEEQANEQGATDRLPSETWGPQAGSRRLDTVKEVATPYSTSVVRASKLANRRSVFVDLLEDGASNSLSPRSTVTVKQNVTEYGSHTRRASVHTDHVHSYFIDASSCHGTPEGKCHVATAAPSMLSIDSAVPLYHRFTLVKNGCRRPSLTKHRNMSLDAHVFSSTATSAAPPKSPPTYEISLLNSLNVALGPLIPPAVMLAQALSKCQVCNHRLGWRPFLDCDDCPYRCHVACGDLAEPTCQELVVPDVSTDSKAVDLADGRKLARRGSNNPILTPFNAQRDLTASPVPLSPRSHTRRPFDDGHSSDQQRSADQALKAVISTSPSSSSSSPNRKIGSVPPPTSPSPKVTKLRRWSRTPPSVTT